MQRKIWKEQLDSRLLDIQQLIAKATAALVNASDKLHRVMTALADPSTRVEHRNRRFVAGKETLAANGDVITLLGTAQQDRSYRRRCQLQPALPKDTCSIYSNVNFWDDVEKTVKIARKTHKLKSAHTGRQH